METKQQKLLDLIDQAILIGEQISTTKNPKQADNFPQERLNRVIHQLETLKTKTLNNQLEPSQGTLSLGLARDVADWIDSLDSPLLKAVGAVEHYYQEQF
ncbi:conserved hypothetical protein [Gloeothece citriformis PCC 7424]|uniref:Uncharacterized protein n=1 Tax=Gloeothece citriformis (strain PCC 7424) TaxID=65393 RepID=B7KH43_GLOC7|nr:hypothetical protein [Gloeothece citriformis]ACK69252.1 conserved hypothetical protein [Gloeothece citriformis PCC 7424]